MLTILLERFEQLCNIIEGSFLVFQCLAHVFGNAVKYVAVQQVSSNTTYFQNKAYLSEQFNVHENIQKYRCIHFVISRVFSASRGHLILAIAPWMLTYGFLLQHHQVSVLSNRLYGSGERTSAVVLRSFSVFRVAH
jgi:hypothetical protein